MSLAHAKRDVEGWLQATRRERKSRVTSITRNSAWLGEKLARNNGQTVVEDNGAACKVGARGLHRAWQRPECSGRPCFTPGAAPAHRAALPEQCPAATVLR